MKIKSKVVILLLITFFSCLLSPLVTYAEVPTWRILWIILPRVNAVHNGVIYNYSLNADEIQKIHEMSERTENFFESASNNAVNFEITIMESTGTITSLTETDKFLFVDEKDFPSDVKNEITRASDNARPYHLRVANFKLNGENEKLNSWHGLGGGTYARVRFLGLPYYTITETNPHPEETWVHELLHCFEWLFAGLDTIPSNHDGSKYGYGKASDSIWWRYYWDIISGQVKDPSTGNLIGIKPYMWQNIPKGRVKVWNGHTYKINDLTMTWQEAKAYCENLGGHLATITTKDEQDMLNGMLKDLFVKYDAAVWYWLGASKSSGTWKWITNEDWSYDNFYADWSGASLQIYSAHYDDYYVGKWFSSANEYNRTHGFICEWDYDNIIDKYYNDDIAITTTSLPNGIIGSPYSTALAVNLSSAVTWTLINGTSLPEGLVLDRATGRISGTPAMNGTSTFTVSAVSGSSSATKTLSITVNGFQITTSSLPDADMGEYYSRTLESNGSNLTWQVISGTLPQGLSLHSQSGLISGWLSSSGTYTFTVRAQNMYANASKSFTVSVKNKNDSPTGNHPSDGDCNSAFGSVTLLILGLALIRRR